MFFQNIEALVFVLKKEAPFYKEQMESYFIGKLFYKLFSVCRCEILAPYLTPCVRRRRTIDTHFIVTFTFL